MTTNTGPSTDQAYLGNASASSASSEFNLWSFMIQSALTKVRTAQAVKVIACTNAGGLTAAGTVDVQPLVNQIDGYGKPTPHGTIFKRPYLRWRGGTNAIIMDPVAGDIGLLVCCDRDTSTVLNTLAQANPGSRRSFDFADGFYIQALGKGVPVNFIQFVGNDINITATETITITATTDVDIVAHANANVTASTKATVTAPEVDIISDNVNLGGTGGTKVALVGDNVSGGVITGPGATHVKAV